jgi:hypothetical protein
MPLNDDAGPRNGWDPAEADNRIAAEAKAAKKADPDFKLFGHRKPEKRPVKLRGPAKMR